MSEAKSGVFKLFASLASFPHIAALMRATTDLFVIASEAKQSKALHSQ
jgi:hypothetical protein